VTEPGPRAALPYLLSRRGAVVPVASVAALRASSGMGGYAVTKAGLVMLTQSLAVDHAHQGLRANVVCPGWTVTEMADEEMAAFGASRGLAVAEAYDLVTALVPQRARPGPRRWPRSSPGCCPRPRPTSTAR
jgi:meso-butanediol dehydrogenase / (S,S)-butanediol dehydrogenase / diacetyl reductase